MGVREVKMLRWACGFTKLDKIRNEKIRPMLKVAPIEDKLRENRLRWYGHIQRREETHATKKVLNMAVQGKRSRGRPELRWVYVINQGMKKLNLKTDDAMDRKLWKKHITTADPKDTGQTRR